MLLILRVYFFFNETVWILSFLHCLAVWGLREERGDEVGGARVVLFFFCPPGCQEFMHTLLSFLIGLSVSVCL